MDREDHTTGTMVANENCDIDDTENGITFVTKFNPSEKVIMENSDNVSTISVDSDYETSVLDDVLSMISNTTSCPDFTRKVESKVFSEKPIINNPRSVQNTNVLIHPQTHKKIRRVPSGANPRHRISPLHRPQRSASLPQIQVNQVQFPRRFSQAPASQGIQSNQRKLNNKPKNNVGAPQQAIPSVHQKNQQQRFSNQQRRVTSQQQKQQHQTSQQLQQPVIYVQLPQSDDTQLSPEELQQQISSQLNLLVPQICSQLLEQMGGSINDSGGTLRSSKSAPQIAKLEIDNISSNKIISQNYDPAGTLSNPRKRKKTSPSPISPHDLEQTVEVISETIANHIPQISQCQNNGVPQYTVPQLAIPLSQELIFQQQRDYSYGNSFQPGLETIHEESLSIKNVKLSKFPKSKILACIMTILSVIVVIAIADDKHVAIIVITVIFIIFFLALCGFLYLNSAKNSMQSAKDPRNMQIGTLESNAARIP